MASDNPYRDASNPYMNNPEGDFTAEVTYGPDGEILLPSGQRRGMVGHVPVLGWLMVVLGVFELLFGIGLIALGFFVPTMMAGELQNNPALQGQAADMTPEQLGYLIMAVYGGMGVGLLVISLLTIVGGFQITRYKSYVLGIVALSAGFFSIIAGCYCFPVALPLGVYGLIVILNDPVKRAFDIGKKGYTARQIREAFAGCPK